MRSYYVEVTFPGTLSLKCNQSILHVISNFLCVFKNSARSSSDHNHHIGCGPVKISFGCDCDFLPLLPPKCPCSAFVFYILDAQCDIQFGWNSWLVVAVLVVVITVRCVQSRFWTTWSICPLVDLTGNGRGHQWHFLVSIQFLSGQNSQSNSLASLPFGLALFPQSEKCYPCIPDSYLLPLCIMVPK